MARRGLVMRQAVKTVIQIPGARINKKENLETRKKPVRLKKSRRTRTRRIREERRNRMRMTIPRLPERERGGRKLTSSDAGSKKQERRRKSAGVRKTSGCERGWRTSELEHSTLPSFPTVARMSGRKQEKRKQSRSHQTTLPPRPTRKVEKLPVMTRRKKKMTKEMMDGAAAGARSGRVTARTEASARRCCKMRTSATDVCKLRVAEQTSLVAFRVGKAAPNNVGAQIIC
mmetsp:Transcript_87171/g.232393  ORF Transcript_87171/g.232393 Transcript_87171/m.232393 type:complete len:230 (-) Transcript_87171:113-802(-)